MASIDDLKNVLKETLDNRGVLNQIRARIRAEVFSALDDQTEVKPVLSNENMFINELIREYLEFNSYKYTSTVLTAESGQPKDPIDREFLAAELNIRESKSSKQLPILYGLVSYFLDNRHKDDCPERDSSGRRSPVTNGRRSSVSNGRRSPVSNGRRSPVSNGRRSPVSNGRRSPVTSEGRSPPSSGRQSPAYSGARSPVNSRRPISVRVSTKGGKTKTKKDVNFNGELSNDDVSSMRGLVYHGKRAK